MSSRYLRGTIVLFRFKEDWIGRDSALRLGLAYLRLGFDVMLVTEDDLGIRPAKAWKEMNTRALEWFKEWFQEEERVHTGVPDSKLLVLYFIGHGISRNGVLIATNEDSGALDLRFDMTALRLYAQRHCKFDILFMLECCEADTDNLPPVPPDSQRPGRIMETVAAGRGTIDVFGDTRDWSQRWAEYLEREQRLLIGFVTVKQICDTLVGSFHKRDLGNASIVLPQLPRNPMALLIGNVLLSDVDCDGRESDSDRDDGDESKND